VRDHSLVQAPNGRRAGRFKKERENGVYQARQAAADHAHGEAQGGLEVLPVRFADCGWVFGER
jgi:hypothetical protein